MLMMKGVIAPYSPPAFYCPLGLKVSTGQMYSELEMTRWMKRSWPISR